VPQEKVKRQSAKGKSKKPRVAQRGRAATKYVGASLAGFGPNAVRPYIARKMFAKKTRIYGIAMQGGRAATKNVLVNARRPLRGEESAGVFRVSSGK
jgi:hypothetical protein